MKKKIMGPFRRILAEVGRNEMLVMGYTTKKQENKVFRVLA